MSNTSKRSNNITAAVIIISILCFFTASGIGCPIRFVTGISCPGCGLTRAWISACHLHFHEAFYFHPLFLLFPVAVFVVIFEKKLNRNIYNALIAVLIGAFIIVYIIRMLNPADDIVTINIANSVPIKLFKFIRGYFKW